MEEDIAAEEAAELAAQLGVDLGELPAMLAADKGEDLEEEAVIGESGELSGTFFAPATIDCYVAAVVELWRAQVSTPFVRRIKLRALILGSASSLFVNNANFYFYRLIQRFTATRILADRL